MTFTSEEMIAACVTSGEGIPFKTNYGYGQIIKEFPA